MSSTVQQIENKLNKIDSIPIVQGRQLPSTTLSTKNLFTHYFLIHDFLFRMVKSSSKNGNFFDLQIQVNQSMRNAARIGGKFGQIGTFGTLMIYCIKGKSIKLRFLYGFLYMYWIDHFYSLGSYLGVLLRMPSLYQKTGQHFLNNQPLNNKNYFLKLNQQMKNNQDYQDTQQILNRVFGEQIIQTKNYVVNQYFAKNKEKYFTDEEGTNIQRPTMKLKYLDCFLTRYIYYSFDRWARKRLIKYGLMQGQL